MIKKRLKKKLLSNLSTDKLLSKAQDEIDAFNYTDAHIYCQEALKRHADNVRALEVSANLCLETNNINGAKHCLGRAITLAPENGFTKYLLMGQLLNGKDSLQCYWKGVELIEKTMKDSGNNHATKTQDKENIPEDNSEMCIANENEPKAGEEENAEAKGDQGKDESTDQKEEVAIAQCTTNEYSLTQKLSNAYSAIAELYMSDLCDEEEAETECQKNLEKAMQLDPSNPEALQHYANFLVIKQEFEKAKETIKKSVSLWLPKYQAVEDDEAEAGTFDPIEVCPLTQSMRFQTAQILMEVEEYDLAEDVLEGLLGENDEVVYTWYLLGWNLYLEGSRKFEAKQHFEQAMQLHKSTPSDDIGIIEHMKELLEELKGIVDEDDGEIEEDGDDDIEDIEREIEGMEVS